MKRYICRISLSLSLLSFWMFIGGVLGVHAEQKVKIGVIHIRATHPDHIVLRESFLDELKKRGYEVEVMIFDADSATYPDTYAQRAAEEAKRMEAAGVQLIYCTATYHGVITANVKIPVIDSVMLSPLLLNLATVKDGKIYSIGNATGTMFGYSFKDIVAFTRAIMPNAKQIAYLYNPKSPVSRPLSEIAEEAEKVGLEVVDCQFTDKEGVFTAIAKAVSSAPIAFATNDVAVFGIEKQALEFAGTKNYPIIVGVVPIVELGALAGIQYNWERAGRICAAQAEQIFKGVSANTLPLEFPDRFDIGLNLKIAEKLGIEIPYEWIEIATKVIQ
jgi:ABC-type uncharacterized transport system substrate-binding protein